MPELLFDFELLFDVISDFNMIFHRDLKNFTTFMEPQAKLLNHLNIAFPKLFKLARPF